MTATDNIKQTDVALVVNGARDAGYDTFRIEVDFVNGKVSVWPTESQKEGADKLTPLEKWKADRDVA